MSSQEVALSEVEQLTIERDALAQEFADLQNMHRITARENARLKTELEWWVEEARRQPRFIWGD